MPRKLKYLIGLVVILFCITSYAEYNNTNITFNYMGGNYYRKDFSYTLGADGYYRRIVNGGGGTFYYWTNPVPVRMWLDGITNAQGNARDVSNNVIGYITGCTQAVAGVNTDGKTNYCISFDGIDDFLTNGFAFYANPVSPYQGYTNFEICAWVKSTRTVNTTINGYLFNRGRPHFEALYINGTYVLGGDINVLSAANSTTSYTSKYEIVVNDWVHISYVRNDFGHISIYTNGELALDNAAFDSPLNGANWSNLVIGVTAGDMTSYDFQGYIDDIMIFPTQSMTYAQRTNLIANSNPTNSHLQIIAPP